MRLGVCFGLRYLVGVPSDDLFSGCLSWCIKMVWVLLHFWRFTCFVGVVDLILWVVALRFCGFIGLWVYLILCLGFIGELLLLVCIGLF